MAGTFGAFTPGSRMRLADGGWLVFEAPIVGDPTADAGVYVWTPGRVLTLVFAEDDQAPSLPPGTLIDAFEDVWITTTGKVAVRVELTGSAGEAVLTADVANNGVVTNATAAIATGDVLPMGPGPSPLDPGTLVSIDEDVGGLQQDDDGDLFFIGTGSTGITGLWMVTASGATLAAVNVEGDAVPSGTTGTYGTFSGVGVNTNGGLMAFAARITNGTRASGLFAANTVGQRSIVALEDDTLPSVGGRTLDDVWTAGPIVVFVNGTTSFVAWQGGLSGATPNQAVFWRNMGPVLGPIVTVAAPGLPTTGVSPGQFGDVRLLDSQNDPSHVAIDADVVGNVNVQRAVYRVTIGASPTTQVVFRDADPAPGGGGALFTDVLPSLAQDDGLTEVAFDGGLGFSAVLSDNSAHLWWAPSGGCSLFLVASEGQAVPDVGAGTFGDLNTYTAVTVGVDAFAFRAPILGVPGTTSGIFVRQ
jgi:hypothetical protein